MAANFTCSRIWRGSGGGGACSRLITVLARVCAMPARRLESSALFTVPLSTMVSPRPGDADRRAGGIAERLGEQIPLGGVFGDGDFVADGSAPVSQTTSVVRPGPLAFTITSRGEITTASAIFGSEMATLRDVLLEREQLAAAFHQRDVAGLGLGGLARS